ncbi:MAG TPA: MBL fold metallo-hydrolase [Candidatus Thermoplasmatota archaeon]|nr:MBL fold metallo-hydrolase [Candidatus Thermoplasmatota archaeon]
MQIKILGTRGEIKPSIQYHSHHSGVLLDGKILFDIGEKEFLNYHPTHIFITHLHPDHAYFVRKNHNNNFDFQIPVYAPEPYNTRAEIKIISKKLKIKSYDIIPIPTHHSKKVESVAYLIQQKNQRILYTGDLIWINKEHHHLLNDLDLVITEASFIQKNGMVRRDKNTGQLYGHAGIPKLINLFKKFSSSILFTHFGEWFYENIPHARKQLYNLGKKHKVNVIVGYDGLKLDVSNLL